jgi:hypothetical protein
MLTLNLPQNYLLLQDAFIKNIEKIKKADFCNKVLSLNATEFAEFQNELKSLTTDKKIPNKYQALYDACFENYASLQMARELETSEFAHRLPSATPVAKDAMLAYRIAFRFLENQIVKALNFEVNTLEKAYKDLDAAREDFQNKQALATYALMTGLDGRVAPDAGSKNDNKPGTPPVNENLLYVSDVVAFENAQRKKQEDAENESFERTRREKEQEDMQRAAEESARAKAKALEIQKIEEEKRLKSNEEARTRNAIIAKEQADNTRKKQEFLPSYSRAHDVQVQRDRLLFVIVSEQVADNAKKYPHKILEIIEAGRKLEGNIKSMIERRDNNATTLADKAYLKDYCLTPENIKNTAEFNIDQAMFQEERAQEEAMRLADIKRQEEEQAQRQERPMMMR